MKNEHLNEIIYEMDRKKIEQQKKISADLISNFLEQISYLKSNISGGIDSLISARINELDDLITGQLNQILHHPDFQDLESSWRGLLYFVRHSKTSPMLRICLLSCHKKELINDFEAVPSFDQTALFKLIYIEKYNQLTSDPYHVLIGDFEFGNNSPDLFLLEKIAELASVAHAPFLAAASPNMFGWDTFEEMFEIRDYSKIFDREEYTAWRNFRESENSRYIGLFLPRLLGRKPYIDSTKSFRFEEDVDNYKRYEKKKFLWVNPVYYFGTCLTQAFSKYGWWAEISGVENGGLIEELPVYSFRRDREFEKIDGPVEIKVNGRREYEFAYCGFSVCEGMFDYAVFWSPRAINRPQKYDADPDNHIFRKYSEFKYIFAESRFAHYLKFMMRDIYTQSPTIAITEVEDKLNGWINKYVLKNEELTEKQKAIYPLSKAKIELMEIAGKPGAFRAKVAIVPQYQFEKLPFPLEITVDMPQIYLES